MLPVKLFFLGMRLWARLKIFENLRALMYLVVGGWLREWGCGSGKDCGFFDYWSDFLKLKFVKGI